MSKRNPITFSEIGRIYGTSKQGAFHFVKKYGRDVVENPDAFFAALLEGKACTTRALLSHPAGRERARLAMRTAPFRLAVAPRPVRKSKAKPSTP
jgi:hypothetical protein